MQEGRISAKTPVVVLANRDKQAMDAAVKEALAPNSPLKVHTRSGNPATFSALEVASAGDAKYVLFNKPVGSDVVIHDMKERAAECVLWLFRSACSPRLLLSRPSKPSGSLVSRYARTNQPDRARVRLSLGALIVSSARQSTRASVAGRVDRPRFGESGLDT